MSKAKSRSNNKYVPKSFETIGGSTLHASLFATMLQSEAFLSLNKGAQALYIYAKLQYYGNKRCIPGYTKEHFYLNWSLVSQTYPLYTNHTQFEHDRDLLIKHGLIELVANGKSNRTKSIYKYSDKWKIYKNG